MIASLAALLLLFPSQEKRLPPPGIDLPPAEEQAIQAVWSELDRELGASGSRYFVDAAVIRHAIADAREHRDFLDLKDIPAAKDLLKLGLERARALKAGQAPWTTATGLLPLGYTSRIDDSLQPYGLVVPAGFRPGDGKKYRLDLWLHGRDEKLTQLRFLHQRMKSAGEFTPPDTIVLHLYGRFCNAFKFAGETDVFEALADVKSRYPVDEDRVLLRGFSMGGAGAWQLGAHHAGTWAAVAPGAGFVETERYANVAKDPVPPSPWHRTLWKLTNATDYALNFFNTAVIAYSGELDKQKQAADFMAEAMKREGLELPHLIGPKTEHKYEPETKKELIRRLDALAARGRDLQPAELRWSTFTLRYNKVKWLHLEGLGQHWEEARVSAARADGLLTVTTKNVTAFGAEPRPLPGRVNIDGQELPYAPVFHRKEGRWRAGPPEEALRKRPGLQGPIDDAFMDRFILVLPSGKPMHEATGAWVARESKRAQEAWRTFFRGRARVCLDTKLEPRDIDESNLVLWGDPSSNAVIARIADKLPLRWTADALALGTASVDASRHLPALIHPNPLNPRRYVVLNSGYTFIDQSAMSNSRHVAMLPDWALQDVTRKIFSDAVHAGFFDEQWKPR